MNRKGHMIMNISYAKVQCRLFISIRFFSTPKQKNKFKLGLCLKKTIEFDNFSPDSPVMPSMNHASLTSARDCHRSGLA